MPPTTRDLLLDSALRLLDAGGVETVTLREVGIGAGVSHNAPYKHFASKQALLAAVAARELSERATEFAAIAQRYPDPAEVLREVLHSYIAWALSRPARFKLVFGSWSVESPELAEVAHNAQQALVALVARAQAAGTVPAGDPERLAALLRALAHGAADLAAAGHLSAEGKGHADPADLVDDLLAYLRASARVD
ncbi:TetR/AcrR family transcriptional regulator [Nocardia wallacei]|uniref:TetR/AcrR family transcriptional regulator n=1 Tax=Nocardia wallacei TaxID=480035 RepID=UPI002453A37A|nr:TetR/AcrR family transcriptional regulator [Nocardia wallacei]